MSQWEPVTRTQGRGLGSDLRRLLTLADPRRTLYRDAHYFAATVEVDPAAMKPWLPRGIRLAEVRDVTGFELQLGGSERDPLDQMGLGQVLTARLHRVDLSAGLPPVPVRPVTPLFTATHLRPRVL